MNKERRKKLEGAFKLVEEALAIVQSVRDDEIDAQDSLEERFPGSEQLEKMGETIGYLEDADKSLESALVEIEAAKE
jgi:hypothetical protein